MEPCAHQHLCKYTKQTLQNTVAKKCIKILKMAATECGLDFSFKLVLHCHFNSAY